MTRVALLLALVLLAHVGVALGAAGEGSSSYSGHGGSGGTSSSDGFGGWVGLLIVAGLLLLGLILGTVRSYGRRRGWPSLTRRR